MKIRTVDEEQIPKVTALLKQAFPQSRYEMQLFTKLHAQGRVCHEWVCLYKGKVAAYILYTQAFDGKSVCGLHLAPVAVKPEFQNEGIGSELIRYSLRQDVIKSQTLFVLGKPKFYEKFGFKRCTNPVCPFDKDNKHFLTLGGDASHEFTIGYEPEFLP
jgi:putative acetyltransferase